MIATGFSLIALLSMPLASPPADPPDLREQSEGRATEVDRLHHAAGTVTGPAGLAHVERRGKGPVPLLCIAGAPFGWRAFEGFMQRNGERYTMIAVTPAGYDGTPPPAMPAKEHEDYGERAWTEALMTQLAALVEKEWPAGGKLGRPVVIGHHLMGDYYAVRLAAQHPGLVRGLVAVAGQGSAPIGKEGDRLAYVRDSRAPWFRTVSQGTWNANTFDARTLSIDPARGKKLFEAEIAVPLPTQIRYYLEHMTDDLEPLMPKLDCRVLALDPKPKWGFENLSKDMQDQLVAKFGSLEAAKQEMHFGGAWDGLALRAKPGFVRLQQVDGAGVFMMDDLPEVFDRALFEFVESLSAKSAPSAESPAGKKDVR